MWGTDTLHKDSDDLMLALLQEDDVDLPIRCWPHHCCLDWRKNTCIFCHNWNAGLPWRFVWANPLLVPCSGLVVPEKLCKHLNIECNWYGKLPGNDSRFVWCALQRHLHWKIVSIHYSDTWGRCLTWLQHWCGLQMDSTHTQMMTNLAIISWWPHVWQQKVTTTVSSWFSHLPKVDQGSYLSSDRVQSFHAPFSFHPILEYPTLWMDRNLMGLHGSSSSIRLLRNCVCIHYIQNSFLVDIFCKQVISPPRNACLVPIALKLIPYCLNSQIFRFHPSAFPMTWQRICPMRSRCNIWGM